MNQLSSLQKNLIFHWEGSEANPLQDNISRITAVGTDVFNVADRMGSGSNRHYFSNGSSDYTTLPTSMPPFSTGDFTVIRKVKTGAIGAVRTLIGGAANSFELYISATGYLTALKYGGSALTASTTLLAANTEYKLAYIKSGSTGTYYVNNTAAGTTTDTNDYSVKCTLLGNGTGFFNGLDFMTRCFNFALTPTVQLVNYSRPEYPIEAMDRGATGVNLTTLDFSDGWSTDAGWSVSAGKAVATNSSDYIAKLLTNKNKKYYWRYELSERTAGTVRMLIGGDAAGGFQSINNTYVGVSNDPPVTNNYIYFNGSNFTGKINNVFVTQLGCVLDLNSEGINRQNISTVSAGYWWDATNNITATVSGATVVIPSASNLGAMFFAGASKIDLTSMNGLLGNITISFWMNSLDLNGRIIDSGNLRVTNAYASGQKIAISRDGWNVEVAYSGVIVANTWYNITITSTSAGITNIYINGFLSGTANQSSGTLASSTSWTIGNNGAGSAPFYGILSNIPIWNRILDQDQISLLYQLGH